MRKLTLDETWKKCLSMWRWVAKQRSAGRRDVNALKEEWLKKHGYKDNEIHEDCFFCHAAPGNCPACPGRKVEKGFFCGGLNHRWNTNPIAFYNKLRSLNHKRLAKKKERS